MKTQILLVDDEEHMLRLLQFCLKPIPASIHCVKRGNAAVEFLKANHPNLVLLDYAMPGMDGVELCVKFVLRNVGARFPSSCSRRGTRPLFERKQPDSTFMRFLPSHLVRATWFGARGNSRELKGRAAEKCDMTREQAVRALSGIFQAKPSEASLENPLCEIVVTKVGPAAVFPSKTHRNS